MRNLVEQRTVEQQTFYTSNGPVTVEIPVIQPSPVVGRKDGAVGPSFADRLHADFDFAGALLNLSERLSFLDRAKKVATHPLNAAVLALTLAACNASKEPQFATAQATATPAATLGPVPTAVPTRTPEPARTATPTKTPEVQIQQTPETYTLLNIESRQWAAKNLGRDAYSMNPDSWDDPVVTKEGDKFIHLKQKPNEVHTLVAMTDKTVGQAWQKIKTTDSGVERFVGNQVLDAQAQVLVLSPGTEAPVKEITVRMADNVQALLRDSVSKMIAKEAIEQPGVPVVLVCPPSEITAKGAVGSYSLLEIPSSPQMSAEEWATKNFGVEGDGWSDKASSWEVKVTAEGDRYAHLKQRPNEVHSQIKTPANAVGQAWAKVKMTDSGVERFVGNQVLDAQASAFLVLPNVQMRVKEITIRLSNNVAALAVDSYQKFVAKEALEQPEVKVLIACPVFSGPGGKGGGPTPTPEGGAKGPFPDPTPTPTPTPSPRQSA